MPKTPPQYITFNIYAQRQEDGKIVATYTPGSNDYARDESLIRDYLKVELTQDVITDTQVSGAATVTAYSHIFNTYGHSYKLHSVTYQLDHDCQTQQTTVSCNGKEEPRATQAAHRFLRAVDAPNKDTTVSDALHCAILADLRPTHYIPVEHNGSHAEDIGAAADIQLAALASTVDYLTYPKEHTAS